MLIKKMLNIITQTLLLMVAYVFFLRYNLGYNQVTQKVEELLM